MGGGLKMGKGRDRDPNKGGSLFPRFCIRCGELVIINEGVNLCAACLSEFLTKNTASN